MAVYWWIPRIVAVFLALVALADVTSADVAAVAEADSQAVRESAHEEPAEEVRAVWVSNALLGRLGGPDAISDLLDDLAALHVNLLFPEAIFRGRTLYPGPYQDPRFRDWDRDPLAVFVQEAAARGMEVHPWVWVFQAGRDAIPGPLLSAHPELAECAPGGGEANGAAHGAWLSPALPGARRLLLNELVALVAAYPVQGLHLDYIRFGEDACPGGDTSGGVSARRFFDETGIDPRQIAPGSRDEARWRLWREEQVNAFVAELNAALQTYNPDLLLSAAVVAEIREARYRYSQNWEHWLANGWVDFVVPMAYSSQRPVFEHMIHGLQRSSGGRYPIIPGLAVWVQDEDGLAGQIERVREAGFPGASLFAADHLQPRHLAALREGVFRHRPEGTPRSVLSAFSPRRRGAREPVAATPPPLTPAPSYEAPPGTNLALKARVEVDSSFRGYGPAPLTDGERHAVLEVGRWTQVAWASAEEPVPHWIELSWDRPHRMSRVDVYWALDRGAYYGSREYRIEVWDGTGWRTVFHYVVPEGTLDVPRHAITFPAVVTDRLRIVQPPGGGPPGRPHLMWVAEVEVYSTGVEERDTVAEGDGSTLERE